MDAAQPNTDPVLTEIVRNALDAIADEIALIVLRTACSGIVRDSMDYSTAVCDAAGGTLAQGLTTPLHLGSFHDAMQALIRRFEGDVAEGDVFFFNDPYLAAGQHLPDLYIVRPVFVGGSLEAWATTVAHHNDVGGIVPGSNSIGSTEIYQEGLRLPFLKLASAGVESKAILDILAANVRVPEKVLGDLNAQIAATAIGVREIQALFAKYGKATLRATFAEIHDHAERLARSVIAEIPDGTYRFESWIDGFGETPEPIRFCAAVTVAGDEITVDMEGTSPQVPAGINAPVPFTKAACYAAIRSIMGEEIPNAQGFTRPIHVKAPLGSIVNPKPPGACGARGITGFRTMDTVFGALAQAVPNRVPADGNGGSSIPAIGGEHQGKPFVFVETFMGNWGGSAIGDGQEGVTHMGANQSNVPVEMIEAEYPIRIEQYGLVPDSGGPGKHRGGLSMIRDYRFLGDAGTMTLRSDKRRFPPYGLAGGKPGAPCLSIVNPDREARSLPVLITEPVTLRKGDLFRHVLPGAGGWGEPFERDSDRVLEDVRLGKVTRAHAREAYGVVIAGEPPRIDAEATRKARGS
ncbi:MAG: hydantoinase B/oxoprolinase family protein [Alphaproteobacteria bacterium]|nr:hydantoinase B/oxoprolinase family protein [Alphaproteobacteria bacterium]